MYVSIKTVNEASFYSTTATCPGQVTSVPLHILVYVYVAPLLFFLGPNSAHDLGPSSKVVHFKGGRSATKASIILFTTYCRDGVMY